MFRSKLFLYRFSHMWFSIILWVNYFRFFYLVLICKLFVEIIYITTMITHMSSRTFDSNPYFLDILACLCMILKTLRQVLSIPDPTFHGGPLDHFHLMNVLTKHIYNDYWDCGHILIWLLIIYFYFMFYYYSMLKLLPWTFKTIEQKIRFN